VIFVALLFSFASGFAFGGAAVIWITLGHPKYPKSSAPKDVK